MGTIFGDPQKLNAHGLNFLIGQGVLGIAELQYAYPSPNATAPAGENDPLARAYKIGFWYDRLGIRQSAMGKRRRIHFWPENVAHLYPLYILFIFD